jgi:D-glycero-D-manno-heptose 1,7-bisphosphate phosphatase
MPGSLEAIAKLTQAGYKVVIASNQSGIGRGLFDMDTLNAIHDKMHRAVQSVGGRIDAVFYCPHTSELKCNCRKPKPGMFLRIGGCFNTDLSEAFVIGDSLRDLQPAASVGARPVLVLTGKGGVTQAEGDLPEGTLVFADLATAVDYILKS